MWILQDDTIIKTPKRVTVGGESYPPHIFGNQDKLDNLGIRSYEETRVNERYYWTSGISFDRSGEGAVVGTHISTPRDVEGMKERMKSEVNNQVSSMQGSIDWYWIRSAKGRKPVPADIEQYSSDIYREQEEKESIIDSLSAVEDIIFYENKPHIEVRKVKHTSEDGVETYGPDTEEYNRDINMLMHWTSPPNSRVDLAFVSLTAV
jgi:hypothetical protein